MASKRRPQIHFGLNLASACAAKSSRSPSNQLGIPPAFHQNKSLQDLRFRHPYATCFLNNGKKPIRKKHVACGPTHLLSTKKATRLNDGEHQATHTADWRRLLPGHQRTNATRSDGVGRRRDDSTNRSNLRQLRQENRYKTQSQESS